MKQREALQKPILTVAFIRTKSTTQEQVNKFLSFFNGDDIVPAEHWEIPGDRQTTVMNIFAAARTPYVTIVNPDGVVNLDDLLTAADLLEQKVTAAFTTVRVCHVKVSGEEVLTRAAAQVQPCDVYSSPGRLSPVAIYRVAMVNEIIEKFYRVFFGLFEWTLRMVLASKHGFVASDAVGYYYGDGERDSALSVGSGFIEPSMTLNTLITSGLVVLDERQASIIGISLPRINGE